MINRTRRGIVMRSKEEVIVMEKSYSESVNNMQDSVEKIRNIRKILRHPELLTIEDKAELKSEYRKEKKEYYKSKRACRKVERQLDKEEPVYAFSPRR